MASETTFSHSGLHYIEVRGPDAADFHEYVQSVETFVVMGSLFHPEGEDLPNEKTRAYFLLTYEQLGVALTWLRARKAKCVHNPTAIADDEKQALIAALMNDVYPLNPALIGRLVERGFIRKLSDPAVHPPYILTGEGIGIAKSLVRSEGL